MNRARALSLSALVTLAGCGSDAPPSPPAALPTLERAVVRVAAPASINVNIEIPRSAFVERGGLPGVFVLDASGHARFRLVRLGKVAGERLEVISGLGAGEMLVRGGLAEVRDGSPITTKP